MTRGLFLHGFEVWRTTETMQAGRRTEAYALTSTVAGRLSPLGGAEQMQADQVQGRVTLRFSTAFTTDIRNGDEVRRAGRTVLVQVVRHTSSGKRKECICEEVTQ
jgi:SPP1 family predicted phage head-tail adaptor